MKKICLIFLLISCSHKSTTKDQNRVVVSYKGPTQNCKLLGEEVIESNHFGKLEGQELSDIMIGDLVTCLSAKDANYIHVSKVDDKLLKKIPRTISSESDKLEHHRTKVEGHFYLCPTTNN